MSNQDQYRRRLPANGEEPFDLSESILKMFDYDNDTPIVAREDEQAGVCNLSTDEWDWEDGTPAPEPAQPRIMPTTTAGNAIENPWVKVLAGFTAGFILKTILE